MALWTKEQVLCLEDYQNHDRYHPFTCPNRSQAGHQFRYNDWGALVPTEDGWVCPDCGYTQNWAHDFMLTYKPAEHPHWWEWEENKK